MLNEGSSTLELREELINMVVIHFLLRYTELNCLSGSIVFDI